jgi:hypothetical protein
MRRKPSKTGRNSAAGSPESARSTPARAPREIALAGPPLCPRRRRAPPRAGRRPVARAGARRVRSARARRAPRPGPRARRGSPDRCDAGRGSDRRGGPVPRAPGPRAPQDRPRESPRGARPTELHEATPPSPRRRGPTASHSDGGTRRPNGATGDERGVARGAEHPVTVGEDGRAEPRRERRSASVVVAGSSAAAARSVSRTSSSRDCRSPARSCRKLHTAKATVGMAKKANSTSVSRARKLPSHAIRPQRHHRRAAPSASAGSDQSAPR